MKYFFARTISKLVQFTPFASINIPSKRELLISAKFLHLSCTSIHKSSLVKLYYSLVYSHLTYALLAWGRSGRPIAAKIECAHRRAGKLLTYYNQKISTFHLIYDYFALLKTFNTNTLNFHQYFKDKLSSHQLSHMHNCRHRTNSNFYTPLFNHSKLKNVICTR